MVLHRIVRIIYIMDVISNEKSEFNLRINGERSKEGGIRIRKRKKDTSTDRMIKYRRERKQGD